MSLGRRLAELRRAHRYSRKELAKLAGISDSYVAHLEGDKNRPSREVLLKLATALEAPPADLLSAAGYPIEVDAAQRQATLDRMQSRIVELSEEVRAWREAVRALGTVAAAPAFDARAVLAAIPRQPVDLETVTAAERRRLFRAFVARVDWDGASLAVGWTPAGQVLLGEAGRTFAAPPIRKRGGYAAWGRGGR